MIAKLLIAPCGRGSVGAGWMGSVRLRGATFGRLSACYAWRFSGGWATIEMETQPEEPPRKGGCRQNWPPHKRRATGFPLDVTLGQAALFEVLLMVLLGAPELGGG
jgi:hypothetical protein